MKRWICLILAALLILAIAGIAGYRWHETSRARNTAQRVRTLLYKGRLDDAEVVLEHWLKTQPTAAEFHYLKARLAFARHDLPLLQGELTKARAHWVTLSYLWLVFGAYSLHVLITGLRRNPCSATLQRTPTKSILK